MFIKKLDYLSPNVTFYYKGYLSHTSIISGIISIISILIMTIQIGYYCLYIIQRKGLNAFYFNSFLEDVGTFPFNASSLFHFISLGELGQNYWNVGVNFTKYRIIGFETYSIYYLDDKNLSKYNHWLYGLCNNNSDTEGIGYLINYKYFEQSACIRKYFDSKDQKYYDTDHPNFRWPIIGHGIFSKNNIFYNIIVESCKEDTLNLILGDGYTCINDPLIELNTVYFYFINHYIDLLNYKNPNTKFLYRIETGIHKDEFYINNLNFIASNIETNNGLLFDNIKEEKTYIFERNDVARQMKFKKEEDLFISYYFWILNNMNYYQRNYKRIQDVISSIGGFNQVVIFISIYINSFYNKYIQLKDTESLIFSSIYSEKKKMTKEMIENKVSEKIKFSKKDNINKFPIKKDDKNKSNINARNKKIEENINNFSKSDNNFLNNSENITHKFKYPSRVNKIENEIKNNTINEKSDSANITHNKIKNFCEFIVFKLFCKKKYKWFEVYDNFRIKIISEEHLIKNHLNIYNLLRAIKHKKRFRRNSYELKDLINLI